MMPTESQTAAIHVGEGVEATPELLSIVEGRYFLPGERVRALPGTRLSDESDADAAARWTALPRMPISSSRPPGSSRVARESRASPTRSRAIPACIQRRPSGIPAPFTVTTG
ncbi:Hypothetical protein MexAM1_META2p1361 (plasmid) [Methylorubrum extorquens AM1]|uniref:Uncharacterized protein n=1 Tax=Methylorubrum extorquens (strain ATCC 14718 / DSM 1338 / JCM 2805 / NCIMB 9133 / AM1) TaxID=272630 RepID=C5B6L7_METEA|nr:Hypothetical protein MexAM1_META2p1361 [Methylorubrum extorquens AM1]